MIGSFPESATVFPWDADPAKVAAARARGEHVVVLPRPSYLDRRHATDDPLGVIGPMRGGRLLEPADDDRDELDRPRR